MSPRPVPYFDLTAQYESLELQWFEAIGEIGRKGNFILGPAVQGIERKLAKAVGVAHAIAVSSGTDALVLAMRALGVQPGQSVIVPNFGFFATPEAVSLIGAKPKFVDIRRSDFNLDPNCLEAAIDSSTAAIIPVHLFGQPAEMRSIRDIAARHGLAVIEDAAQSFGATENGKPAGGLGDVGCFSFYPTKILGAYGDGGMVTTDDDALADRLRLLRNHGITGPNRHQLVGCTSRLNAVQAKLLEIKLPNVGLAIARRREIADAYRRSFEGLDVECPSEREGVRHVYNIYTIRTAKRDGLSETLHQEQVQHQIYYPMPLHEQKPYASDSQPADQDEFFPQTAAACAEAISLPNYPDMPDSDVERVCQVVRSALA